jgi:serine/threonine protein kinase
LGVNYGSSADIWSFAAMIFELITGDFLFEPRKGESYSKNDDHLAQIMELLGRMPNKLALSGRYSKVLISIILRNTSPREVISDELKGFNFGR